ncbi:MAG: hypothetical protein VB084_14355 [Syntrophomonadaceae bacterium]|nr:hypothetical protein [Syntrophomonadaceae bacterium]
MRYRSARMALLWSMTIPGFGQLYNGDYLVGLLLVLLEFAINVKANLNLAIFYSFQGDCLQAARIANLQWMLFYPCVYAFSLWQAYNQAMDNNRLHDKPAGTKSHTYYNGVFVGAAMIGTLGVIYSSNIGPVFGGLAGMALGALLGWGIEKLIKLK